MSKEDKPSASGWAALGKGLLWLALSIMLLSIAWSGFSSLGGLGSLTDGQRNIVISVIESRGYNQFYFNGNEVELYVNNADSEWYASEVAKSIYSHAFSQDPGLKDLRIKIVRVTESLNTHTYGTGQMKGGEWQWQAAQ